MGEPVGVVHAIRAKRRCSSTVSHLLRRALDETFGIVQIDFRLSREVRPEISGSSTVQQGFATLRSLIVQPDGQSEAEEATGEQTIPPVTTLTFTFCTGGTVGPTEDLCPGPNGGSKNTALQNLCSTTTDQATLQFESGSTRRMTGKLHIAQANPLCDGHDYSDIYDCSGTADFPKGQIMFTCAGESNSIVNSMGGPFGLPGGPPYGAQGSWGFSKSFTDGMGNPYQDVCTGNFSFGGNGF